MDAHRRAHPEDVERLVGAAGAAAEPGQNRDLREPQVAQDEQLVEVQGRVAAEKMDGARHAAHDEQAGDDPSRGPYRLGRRVEW